MRQLKPCNLVEAKLSDFDQSWAELEAVLPELHTQFRHVRLTLRPILSGEVKATWEMYRGWSDTAIRQALGEVPENLMHMINQLELMQPKVAQILTAPESFNQNGVKPGSPQSISTSTLKRVGATVSQNNYGEMPQQVQSLASNWLVP